MLACLQVSSSVAPASRVDWSAMSSDRLSSSNFVAQQPLVMQRSAVQITWHWASRFSALAKAHNSGMPLAFPGAALIAKSRILDLVLVCRVDAYLSYYARTTRIQTPETDFSAARRVAFCLGLGDRLLNRATEWLDLIPRDRCDQLCLLLGKTIGPPFYFMAFMRMAVFSYSPRSQTV